MSDADIPTRRQIVDILALLAIDDVVAGELTLLRNPPGRKPAASTVARSEWFLALDPEGQTLVVDTIRQASYATLHRVLATFDGAAAIAQSGEASRLRMIWDDAGTHTDLTSDPTEPDLHDLLAESRAES